MFIAKCLLLIIIIIIMPQFPVTSRSEDISLTYPVYCKFVIEHFVVIFLTSSVYIYLILYKKANFDILGGLKRNVRSKPCICPRKGPQQKILLPLYFV